MTLGCSSPSAVVLPKQIGEIEGTSGFILIDDLVYFVSLTSSKGFVEACTFLLFSKHCCLDVKLI